ncbi:rho GTPase-activating protein 27-like [Etheostoma cragini]|uniref:rho GTPase-activating protein 27-like n=1 Tax=Etheostoma cragini TaxID=417921 RepID=UPI00155EC3B1|nr:rho GTPase-activating protein 27-like [Etheostoma cragini]
MDRSRGCSPSPLLSPPSSQGSCVWEQLMDDVSGKVYYYNPASGSTSWDGPEPPSPQGPAPNRKSSEGPPPLPEEDYPVNDNVFTMNPQQQLLIPRAHLKEIPALPQRLMGNGVSEEGTGASARNWRHSVAEDVSHR